MPDPMSPSQAPFTAGAVLTAPLHGRGRGGCVLGRSSTPGSHSPQGAEAQSRAFRLRAQAGPRPHGPGHSVTSADEKVVGTHDCPSSTPPLLASLAEP